MLLDWIFCTLNINNKYQELLKQMLLGLNFLQFKNKKLNIYVGITETNAARIGFFAHAQSGSSGYQATEHTGE